MFPYCLAPLTFPAADRIAELADVSVTSLLVDRQVTIFRRNGSWFTLPKPVSC